MRTKKHESTSSQCCVCGAEVTKETLGFTCEQTKGGVGGNGVCGHVVCQDCAVVMYEQHGQGVRSCDCDHDDMVPDPPTAPNGGFPRRRPNVPREADAIMNFFEPLTDRITGQGGSSGGIHHEDHAGPRI